MKGNDCEMDVKYVAKYGYLCTLMLYKKRHDIIGVWKQKRIRSCA